MRRNHFDEPVAARYDDDESEMFGSGAIEPTVEFLIERAGGGAVLELGIGTGRIALPLAERGVEVHGIDLSEAMVQRLREKPGGSEIPVVIGDFATTRLERTFSLAYLVFNTIMNLTTQEEQVACFQSVANQLEPGGSFVIEVGVPGIRGLTPGESVRAFAVTPTRLGFDEFDVANQGLISHHYRIADGEPAHRSIPFRYVWPAELDLMARIAGMKLRERWGGWQQEPFISESEKHVSVWEKLGG